MSIRSTTRNRAVTLLSATLLTAGAVLGLAGCDGGAQTYPDTPESVTPSPSNTLDDSDFPTPVPTSVDDSGTLDG